MTKPTPGIDVAAGVAFVGLAVLQTWPLAAHLGTTLPGPAGDNLAFLWNFWWMREALVTGASVFHTPYLFAPVGVDLTLNTHTALPAFVGATVLAPLSVVAAQNLVTLTALFLNGFCAYRLARVFTDDRGAAFLGGVVFATSAYVSAHLLGHFNLTSAFVLPLFALPFLKAMRGSVRSGLLAGLVMAATAFIDYYYLVYESALGMCLLLIAATHWSTERRGSSPFTRRLSWLVAAGMFVTAAAIAAIATTGGLSVDLGATPLSMRTTYNPLQVFWALTAVWLLLRTRPKLVVILRADWTPKPVALALLATVGVFAIVAAPLLWRGLHLVLSGDYVSQRYFWRSAPAGIDVATLALGNPLHPLWGRGVLGVYARLGLSQTESIAWLGLAAMCLAAFAVRRGRSEPAMRMWLAIGAIFFVWALGPHLMAFGVNTGLILPQTLLRYVPIVSNARMPARAMVVVDLAVAVLAAIGVAHLRGRARRPALVLVVLVLSVVADQLTAPFLLLALDRPHIYETLRDRREPGALCELPMGMVDGFGESGAFDRRTLFYQTIHRRPLVGGFVARLPASVRSTYEADALFSALLRLSDSTGGWAAAGPLPDRQHALEALRANHIGFVMLNRATASPALAAYVEQVLPVTLVAHDRSRSLFSVLSSDAR